MGEWEAMHEIQFFFLTLKPFCLQREVSREHFVQTVNRAGEPDLGNCL